MEFCIIRKLLNSKHFRYRAIVSRGSGSYVQNLTPTHNYSYDKIGNLVADKSEEIEEISWTMQGKVKRITRLPNSDKPDLVFNYDGLGNRVSKTVIPKNSLNSEDSITTYYIRDAQGNILATYEKTKYKNGDEEFYLKEQYLYGSSRIGMSTSNLLLASNVNGSVEIKEYDGYFTKTVGNKRYELTNHLGNVLAVVSDKKLPDNEPDVVSVSDYYPFGMQMPGRIYTNPSNSYRFGFGGHEKVDEVAGTGNAVDMGDRWLSVRLGRTSKMDRKANKYPAISPYATFNNSPLNYVDPNGQENIPALIWAAKNMANKGIPFDIWYGENGGWTYKPGVVPTETVCYESCWTSYMNGADASTLSNFKSTGFATKSGGFKGRSYDTGGSNWFKAGDGTDRQFVADISKGELGDIAFMGEAGNMTGHAVLVAGDITAGSIEVEGKTIETMSFYALSSSSETDFNNYGGRTFTFHNVDGKWLLNGSGYEFKGFGQMTNVEATDEQRQEVIDLMENVKIGD